MCLLQQVRGSGISAYKQRCFAATQGYMLAHALTTWQCSRAVLGRRGWGGVYDAEGYASVPIAQLSCKSARPTPFGRDAAAWRPLLPAPLSLLSTCQPVEDSIALLHLLLDTHQGSHATPCALLVHNAMLVF